MKRLRALDLIDLPYAFSQRRPLLDREFIDEAKARGVELDRGQLEAFHRAGLLIPLYVSSGPMAPSQPSDAAGHRHMQSLRVGGHIVDPREAGFQPWGRFRRKTAWGGSEPTRSWLYSYYQLLGLDELTAYQRRLRPRPTPFERRRYVVRHQPWLPQPPPEAVDISLVALLTRLEPIYLPYVIQRVTLGLSPGGREVWYREFAAYRKAFDPATILTEFETTAYELRDVGERLITRANFLDPNRAWLDIVRQMEPDRWTELGGPGRLAVDLRLSAELVLSCYEDLADSGAAPPLPELPPAASHPLRDRLIRDALSLDRTLTHYGLSPHPAVLVVPEGASDAIIIRKTLALLRVRPGRALIDIASTGGIDKNFDTLIAFSAPDPDQETDGLVIVSRPITRILRVVDAEGRMARPNELKKERQHLIGQVKGAWALKGGPPLESSELDGLVDIMTWGAWPMEFAHFTDGELALAISTLSHSHGRLLAADLRRIRGSGHSGSQLKGLLKKRNVDKKELAVTLWPALEKRICRLQRHGREEEIPVVRVARRAMELGMKTPPGPVGLRKA